MSIVRKNKDQAETVEAKQVDTPAFETAEETNAQVAGDAAVARDEAKTEVEAKAEDKAETKPEADKAEAAPVNTAARGLVKRDESGRAMTLLSSGGRSTNKLAALENAFKAEGIDVDYNTFPRLKLDAGQIVNLEGKDAGKFVELQVLSYHPVWIANNGQDGDEGKEYVRYSEDGTTIKSDADDEWDGKPMIEYRDWLKGKGFEDAAIKEYIYVYGVLLESETNVLETGDICMLSLSPTSRSKFTGYIQNRAVHARMGKLDDSIGNPVVRFSVERVKGSKHTYFNLAPSHGKSKPIEPVVDQAAATAATAE